jgi:acyl-coenzyme A synthetase/AMP-(fatty) acid ligase
MMGVLAAGCFYAPLDPNLPEERLRLIMENLQPALIIADQNTSAKAVSAYPKAHCICASEALQTPMDKKLIQERSEAIEPDDLSMVLYTSGSTGIPKGVAHSHRGMVTWAKATVKRYGFTQDTVFASISPFYYANSLLELFVPMLLGAKVVMIPPSYLTFPKQLISCLQNEGVTELCMTPSSFVVVANSGVLMKGLLPDLDMFIMSGEVMPKVQLKCWMDAAPRAAAMNFYGSTETLSVAVNPVTSPDAEGILPVGRRNGGDFRPKPYAVGWLLS